MSTALSNIVTRWYENEDDLEFNLSRSETMAYVEVLINKSILKSSLRLLGTLQILHLISPHTNDPRSGNIIGQTNSLALMMEQKKVINTCTALLARLKRLQTSIRGLNIPLPKVYSSDVLLGQARAMVENGHGMVDSMTAPVGVDQAFQDHNTSSPKQFGNYNNYSQFGGSSAQDGDWPQQGSGFAPHDNSLIDPSSPSTGPLTIPIDFPGIRELLTNRFEIQKEYDADLRLFQEDQVNIFTTIGVWLSTVESDEKSHLNFLAQTRFQIQLHLQFLLTLASSREMVRDILRNEFGYGIGSGANALYGNDSEWSERSYNQSDQNYGQNGRNGQNYDQNDQNLANLSQSTQNSNSGTIRNPIQMIKDWRNKSRGYGSIASGTDGGDEDFGQNNQNFNQNNPNFNQNSGPNNQNLAPHSLGPHASYDSNNVPDGIDIEAMLYQYDENAQSSVGLGSYSSYLNDDDYGQNSGQNGQNGQNSRQNGQNPDHTQNNLSRSQSSPNMMILYGCVATGSRQVITNTIHRLSRGNVHIEWKDYSPHQQRQIFTKIAQTYLLSGPSGPQYQSYQSDSSDEERVVKKYLGMAMGDFLSDDLSKSLPSDAQIDPSGPQTNLSGGKVQVSEEGPQGPVGISSFVIVFPFSVQIYSKVLRVCSLHHATLFKMPQLQQRLGAGQNYGQNGQNSHNLHPQVQNYLQIVQKYDNLIKRTQVSIYRLLFARITTFKALYQLYLDCCAWEYDRLGTILVPILPQMSAIQRFEEQLRERDEEEKDREGDGNGGGDGEGFGSPFGRVGRLEGQKNDKSGKKGKKGKKMTSAQQSGDFSHLLQISTCIALVTEELSILQAEQYLVPFNQTTEATNLMSPHGVAMQNSNSNVASKMPKSGQNYDQNNQNHQNQNFQNHSKSRDNQLNYRSGVLDGFNQIVDSQRSWEGLDVYREKQSDMFILRAFISLPNLNLLSEQFSLFDDGCSDGFEVRPIINFVHVYDRNWLLLTKDQKEQHIHSGQIGLHWQTYLHKKNLQELGSGAAAGDKVSLLSLQLSQGHSQSLNMFTLPSDPPTQFPSLPLFIPAQELVNTYSVPTYKELNPANMVIGTFPIIFAVMFGDIIHGLMLLIVSLVLYYYFYESKADPAMPMQKDKGNKASGEVWQQNNDLLQHHGELDQNSTALRNLQLSQKGHKKHNFQNSQNGQNGQNGQNDQNDPNFPTPQNYRITTQSGSQSPIKTAFYRDLSALLLQNPVYKAASTRKGLILWFIMIAAMSTYVGFLYNDAAANTTSFFNSYLLTQHNQPSIDYDHYTVYPFGLDPGWMHTGQELTFLNSFKMKMAIILGVLHLYSGIICSIFNHLYFGHFIDLVLTTIPQLLLLTCTFGYMSGLIVFKWCTNYYLLQKQHASGQIPLLWSPVSIIQTMIQMFLSPGSPISQESLIFNGQAQVQLICVIISGLCVPFLFLGEPLYCYLEHRKWVRRNSLGAMELRANYSNRYYSDDDLAESTETRRFLTNPSLTSSARGASRSSSKSPTYSTFGAGTDLNGDIDVDVDTSIQRDLFANNSSLNSNSLNSSNPNHNSSSVIRPFLNQRELENNQNDNHNNDSIDDIKLPLPTHLPNENDNDDHDDSSSSSSSDNDNDNDNGPTECNSNVLPPKPNLAHKIKATTHQLLTRLNDRFDQASSSSSALHILQPSAAAGLPGSGEVSEEEQLDPCGPHYSLGTHFVHHGIHSIEFVLGIVSNTASYLRLWALSLAHAQLSNVFWMQLVTNLGLAPGSNPLGLCIAIMIWFFATVSVLLIMDVMECVLHAVRLVWVEFQSKFYKGGGYLFVPFSLYPPDFQAPAAVTVAHSSSDVF